MERTKAIRHGDLALVLVDKLPEGLTPSTTKTLMQGANKNNHDVTGGTVYLKDVDQFVFGYLVAGDNCTLIHPDHGAGKGPLKTAKLPAGTYELRRQFEETHEAFKPVID
jgi:hypothetical protein